LGVLCSRGRLGHVSSATAGSFWALGEKDVYKLAEYYHSNKNMRYKESKELASDLIKFYEEMKERYRFDSLDISVDNADPGFISQINTLAREQGKYWLSAVACSK